MKLINLSIVSGQSSRLFSSSSQREYVLLYINSDTSFLNILPLLLRFIIIVWATIKALLYFLKSINTRLPQVQGSSALHSQRLSVVKRAIYSLTM
jgi:hypothetical protein